MRPTRFPLLVGVALLTGAIGWSGGLLIEGRGNPLPRVPGSAPAVLLLFTAILLAIAFTTRARLRALRAVREGRAAGRPGIRPLAPLTIARYAMLAKATSPVSAGAVGLYAGYALFLAGDLGAPGRSDRALLSLFAAGSALALVAAALFLERVCRVPSDGESSPGTVPHPRAGRAS